MGMLQQLEAQPVTVEDVTALIELKGADGGELGEDGQFHWNGSIQSMIEALASQVDQPKP